MLLTLLFLLVLVAAGAAGGALSGLRIAAGDLGRELAALMGAFYGLTVSLPAAIVAGAYLAYSMHGG